MKPELGYYLDVTPIGEVKIPIFGLRAVPTEIADRQWGDVTYNKRNWQVEIFILGDYLWVNQARHLIFLH